MQFCSEDLMAAIRDPDSLEFMCVLIQSGADVNLVYKVKFTIMSIIRGKIIHSYVP